MNQLRTIPKGEETAKTQPFEANDEVYRTARAERVAQKSLGPLSYALAISMILNVVLVAAIINLFPLKTTEVVVVEEKDKRYYRTLGSVEETQVMSAMMEAFVRTYVEKRETLNLVNDVDRWNWVADQSAPGVWKSFITRMKDEGVYENAGANENTWAIKILTSWPSDTDESVWRVEFAKQDYVSNVPRGEPVIWVSQMSLARTGELRTPAKVWDNPAGFYVSGYNVTRKADLVKEN